jgi:hypothetical protein
MHAFNARRSIGGSDSNFWSGVTRNQNARYVTIENRICV